MFTIDLRGRFAWASALVLALLLAGCSKPEVANSSDPTATGASPVASALPSVQSSDEYVAESCDWSSTSPTGAPPPFIEGQDPQEPAARVMEDWVWNCVDDGWDVEVQCYGGSWERDDASICTSQVLFLVGHEELVQEVSDYFRLFDLRTDVKISSRFLDPEHLISYLYQYAGPSDNVPELVEFDLATGTARDQSEWAAPMDGYTPVRRAVLDDGRWVWGMSDGEMLHGLAFAVPGSNAVSSAINDDLAALASWGDGAVSSESIFDFDGAPVALWQIPTGPDFFDYRGADGVYYLQNLVTDVFSEVSPVWPGNPHAFVEVTLLDGSIYFEANGVDANELDGGVFRVYLDGTTTPSHYDGWHSTPFSSDCGPWCD